MAATGTLNLPIIDLSSPHRLSTASSIRQACVEYGFFYLVNHGIDEDFLNQAFEESAKFFSLPIQHKINLHRKDYRGYTPLYAEKLDTTSLSQGDSKESYYIGPLTDATSVRLNPWPSQELLPNWRPTMESFFWKLMSAGEKLLSLIALSLNLDENYFDKISALNKHECFLRLLRYPGELGSNEEICGASAHSDYGMITLLLTNGVPGLQICKDKLKQPQVWEDVPHVEGAMIVNIGDMMERWTNCLYQSALHRVMPTGKERYSVAFFMDPPSDCVVECFESCCSESSPPRFPPIRSEDYLNEKFKLTYDSERDLQCSI
ncbi:2-oxoglutarate-Fe(II) type oxidoreductase hxnY-like isoform X1 [Vicia villosa]|uniref:2-oxoglutarate-Fe(II) type oxidoreductase hxnY-like isoform X1 n=1 Tax=Vicia villosa TaxID=3911 RepID=UPI00273BFB14|nr:2-oxoglutarate-Fe(II) type oxidoreductase hxnY-like isoform X1 [Vicia villosa]